MSDSTVRNADAMAREQRLREERDTAQSAVEAWAQVVEGLEAHIKDRAAMRDPASPETYLSILRADTARILKTSEQIRASRWTDYRRHCEQIERLEAAALSPADGDAGAEDDWLVAQLAAWPTRVDREKTTNIEYLMKAAARRIRALTPTETGEQGKDKALSAIDEGRGG